METRQPSLIARDDSFLGVCAGLGEDLGISPTWFRATFGVLLLWNPPAVIGAYLGCAMLVLATRLLVPNPKPAKNSTLDSAPTQNSVVEAAPLPIAA